MPKRKLPPPPDAIPVPAIREGAEWDAWCAEHPLHIAACGKASQAVTEARINQIVDWFHRGKAYTSVVGLGRAEWGLQRARMEELIALADARMKSALEVDRHEYISRMLTKLDGALEAAISDRQFSAAVGLAALMGRWLSLDPSTHRRSI